MCQKRDFDVYYYVVREYPVKSRELDIFLCSFLGDERGAADCEMT